MNDLQTVYDRYVSAMADYTRICAADPNTWHRPDVSEFSALKSLLLPHAESGDVHCQYALAVILWMGLCCESEEEMQTRYGSLLAEATLWWAAAAARGYWPALDNLVTDGVGEQAARAKEAGKELERERGDLVGWADKMPIYGQDFVQELSRRLYGRVITGEA
jgi:hypothetical protein